MKFKIGDKVRRIKENYGSMRIGYEDTIINIRSSGSLVLKNDPNFAYDDRLFELVERGKFEIGKWYWNSSTSFAKCESIENNYVFRFTECILHGNYNKQYGEWGYHSYMREMSLGEIQPYLPEEHPDKIKENKKMKRFKNNFVVKGGKSLLKAFEEELISIGWNSSERWNKLVADNECDYIRLNNLTNKFEYHNHSCRVRVCILPQDWDKALELAAEVEEDKIEVGDYVYSNCPNVDKENFEKFGGVYGKVLSIDDLRYRVSIDEEVYTFYNGPYIWCYDGITKKISENEYDKFIESKKPKFKEGDWLYAGDDVSEALIKFKTLGSNDRVSTDEYYHIVDLNTIYSGASKGYIDIEKCKLATEEQIERILTKVAKQKYPIGTKYKSASSSEIFKLVSDQVTYSFFCGNMIYGGSGQQCLYYEGKWAEIIEETLEVKGYELTEIDDTAIKVGCLYFLIKDLRDILEFLHQYGGVYTAHDGSSWTTSDIQEVLSVLD